MQTDLQGHGVDLDQLKNNPDAQWVTTLNGYFIRPQSKLHTLISLYGIYTHKIFVNKSRKPDWRDHD